MKPPVLSVIGLCAVAAMLCAAPAAAEVRYSVTDIGTLGSEPRSSEAWALNNRGQVAGISRSLAGGRHAVSYWKGELVELGTLGGVFSLGRGINDAGDIVGYSRFEADNAALHAFLYADAAMLDLGTLGGTGSVAQSIDGQRRILGASDLAGDLVSHAFLWEDGVMHDLGTGGGSSSFANGINSAGQIAADSFLEGDVAYHAFRIENGLWSDLGTLGGDNSFVYGDGINKRGTIIGLAETIPGNPGVFHAYMDAGEGMIDLGTLGGSLSGALGINDLGQVVGEAFDELEESRAFLYSEGRMLDLNELIPEEANVHLLRGTDINNRGQIAATGIDLTTLEMHGYLLTPTMRTK